MWSEVNSTPVVIHIIIYLLTIYHAAPALMLISYVLDDWEYSYIQDFISFIPHKAMLMLLTQCGDSYGFKNPRLHEKSPEETDGARRENEKYLK